MLGDNGAMATVAVKDLHAARTFHGATLGLKEYTGSDNPEVLTFESGSSKIMVYRSSQAGTNKATVVTWSAGDDLDAIVEVLNENGVAFEHYDDLPRLTREGDIHVADDGLRVVWFKDPDGNILSIVSTAGAE